jgi:hypothetical protein
MTMNLSGFDANSVEPTATYEPIPAAWYKAVFTESIEKPTKAQTGSYLQMTAEIIEGEYQGRKLIERLNLNNPNSTAVEIAQRTLSAICRATGVMTPRDSSDLHDKPFMVQVKVKPGDGNYGPSNEIGGYEAVTGGVTAAPSAPAAPTGGGSVPPWKR